METTGENSAMKDMWEMRMKETEERERKGPMERRGETRREERGEDEGQERRRAYENAVHVTAVDIDAPVGH